MDKFLRLVDLLINVPYILVSYIYIMFKGFFIIRKTGKLDIEYLFNRGYSHYKKTFGMRYLLSIIIWLLIYKIAIN
jgi:hypothetical protein